jgi:heme/copper-type cytochrome/quinol oxidase subunit 2
MTETTIVQRTLGSALMTTASTVTSCRRGRNVHATALLALRRARGEVHPGERRWVARREQIGERRSEVRLNVLWDILIIVAAVAAAVAAMLLVRRRAPGGGYFSDSDRASGVFGVLATGFAIFAGFVIFLAFSSYDKSRSGAEQEAMTVAQQYQTAQFLPSALSGRVTGQLICYGRSVVGQEWPQMQAGTAQEAINPWTIALFKSMKSAAPKTATEQSAYDRFFEQTTLREDARRDRLHGSEGIIPVSLWAILFLLAGVLFVYVLFYADSAERARAQAMMIGSATLALVVTLLAIYSLNHPYSGVGSIRPVAMERSLRVLDQARTALGDTTTLPCNSTGFAR